jgi:hypothetical protein
LSFCKFKGGKSLSEKCFTEKVSFYLYHNLDFKLKETQKHWNEGRKKGKEEDKERLKPGKEGGRKEERRKIRKARRKELIIQKLSHLYLQRMLCIFL